MADANSPSNRVRNLLKRPRRVGDWTISDHTLGEGAWSVVRLAVNYRTQHVAAAKIVPKEKTEECIATSPSAARRRALLAEADIMRRLNHSNVVKLFEVVEDTEFVYIIHEYCDGGDLFEFVRANGKQTEPAAFRIFFEILQGLLHVHSEGFAHLDVKLENIFIDKTTQRVRLGDFGEAAQKRPEPFHIPCGSPVYSPPETLASRPYDGEAADVWSLGCVLYCLLVGELPYAVSDNPNEILREIATSPLQFPECLSANARDLISQMLQRDESRRIRLNAILQHTWFVQMSEEQPQTLQFLSADDNICASTSGTLSTKASSNNLVSMWDMEDSGPSSSSSTSNSASTSASASTTQLPSSYSSSRPLSNTSKNSSHSNLHQLINTAACK